MQVDSVQGIVFEHSCVLNALGKHKQALDGFSRCLETHPGDLMVVTRLSDNARLYPSHILQITQSVASLVASKSVPDKDRKPFAFQALAALRKR